MMIANLMTFKRIDANSIKNNTKKYMSIQENSKE